MSCRNGNVSRAQPVEMAVGAATKILAIQRGKCRVVTGADHDDVAGIHGLRSDDVEDLTLLSGKPRRDLHGGTDGSTGCTINRFRRGEEPAVLLGSDDNGIGIIGNGRGKFDTHHEVPPVILTDLTETCR